MTVQTIIITFSAMNTSLFVLACSIRFMVHSGSQNQIMHLHLSTQHAENSQGIQINE